jgi:hypothetical protein
VDTAEVGVLRAWDEYAPWMRLTVQENAVSVPVAGRRRRWSIASWPEVPASKLGTEDVLVASSLGPRLRSQMARKGQSFADRHALHLVGDNALIHLERVGLPDDKVDQPRRATRPLPPSGVRAVQVILGPDAADSTWTVRQLADKVDLSVGQAQQILAILQQADLVVPHGSGTSASRRVPDRGALLDWLAEQPAARRSPLQWAANVYGRNGREVLTRAAQGLDKAHCGYAVTGMAAATLAGLGPTELTTVHLWVDPTKDLATVAMEAGMKRTNRGANVVLWSDANRSGEPGTQQIDGIWVAQDPRVYLDLLRLPRGEEIAETYRRVRLGY